MRRLREVLAPMQCSPEHTQCIDLDEETILRRESMFKNDLKHAANNFDIIFSRVVASKVVISKSKFTISRDISTCLLFNHSITLKILASVVLLLITLVNSF